MPKEVNLFTYCGSSQMKEKLWRDMFIAHIFGVDMPGDIEVRRLSDSIKNGISGKEFSPALASLLILYGGGYIDDDAFIRIMPDCENYSDEIAEVEKILVEQGNDEGEDRYNGRIIQNVLMCAAYSKKFDEMQQIDIQSALALYDSTYTIISEGFVHLKDKEFLGMLLENDIEFAAVITDGKNISLEKLTKLDIQNGLDNGDFNDLKEYVDRLMKGEKPSELSIKDCVLLDIKDIAYLTAVYKKPYYKDFLKYVKSENIPFNDKFIEAYEEYVHKCKMKFIIRVYPRRRKICTKFPCWFDYNVPDNKAQEVMEIDLTEVVGKEVEYADEKLTNIALDRYLRSRAMIPETVLEITHGENIYFFIMKTDKEYDRLDNDSFRKIPFDFDDIWTTISEWSRDKKIRKELVGGKPEIIVTPESEWEKIKPQDREYAKRLLEEQVQLKEEQLSKNKFMQKLCELKDDITALEEYQEYIADTGKQFADVTVEFYQIGGDSESVSADDRECAYISEHLQEVMSHNDALCLESETYSVSTPRELLEADEPEQEEVIEHESEIEWTPIPETDDDNGNPTSYSTEYRGEIFFISENGDGKYDVEFENMRHHGQTYYAPINEDFSGFLSRADAEEYFADNIDEYIAVRDEKILDSIVANTTEPTPEEREELAKKSNTLNRFFNNNPKAVFREIVESAGLTPTEDITVGDTKEIFNALKSVDISLMGYTYTLEFEPHDDSLTVKDAASHREADFVWGHARELMYLIANENNISRENLIHNEVLRGTGFEDGKFRVEEFYKTNPAKKDFADFLKKEFGIGGHSGDGPVRFTNYDSKGIDIETTAGTETFTWNEAAKVVSNLIDKGEYITKKDIDNRIRKAQWTINNANENSDFTRLVRAHEILQKYGIEKPAPDNEYKIYQLKKGSENHAIRFEGFSNAERYGEPAKPENYDLVYTGSLDDFEDTNKLEAIYTKFNLDRPEDFKGHSLSVSDIIVMNNEAHYVDSYGFVDVSDRFLGREKEKINVNDYENIRLVRRTEWNDKDLSDDENPAFEEITESYTPDEDGSFTKYATNTTNSIHVDVWEEENSVSSDDMLADIAKHLENMRKGVSSRDYHIELTDHDGNVRTLDNNFFDFVIEESKVIAETMDFPEIPIDEIGAAIDVENSRTDYGYEPAIGDLLEKDDELFRISDITDNIITLEETSSLFHDSEIMTLADFINRGYALVEKAEPSEKVKSPVETEKKSPVDTRESVQTDDDKSPLDTYKNNYVITDENLGVNGPKARFNANIAAVETLKFIEAEGRTATPEEQKILSGYTGWGAIPQAFDPRNDDWKNEYEKLKTVLDDAEYSEARRSTLNAHYTSPVVINAIYEGLANIGFEKGKILEPAMGIGNFFGAMPENMRGSELHGVELDDLTGRIAKQLYPGADIQIKGFEKTAFENNSFDVVVGNVPFGNYKVNDKDYNKNNFLIHDYFIAKSLDKVHPGGVVAVVTSKGTMDKENDDIRKYIAQRAELLGAIRLPETAFKANAGTEVVSDILFLQKRERPIEIDPDKEGWVKLGVSADGFDVNNYFAEHPEMVMGDFKEVSGRFGNEVTVKLDDPSMLKSLLSEAVQNIRGEYKAASVMKTVEEINADVIPAPAESRKFSFQAVNGELYYREAGDTMEKVPVKGKGKDKIARAVAMVELRDTVRELLDLQMNNSDSSLDESVSESRAKLNKVYDAFVAKYGFVSDKKNKDAFKGDDDYQLLSALENEDKEHSTYTKADIFEHNTVKPKTIAEHVETAQEALIISVSEKAKVDFDFMSELCGMDKDSMIADLKGQIFRLPQAEEKYVTSDEYLTGNIRKKIAELNNAPEGMDVSENRAALENAIPPRVEAKDISVKLGSHWIAPEYIRQFICEKFNPDWNAKRDMTVQYSKAAGEWKIEDVNAASKKNYTATNVFGTHRMNAYKIIEGILNNSDLQVKDHKKDENGYDMRDDKGNYILVVNQEETKAVRQVANLIKSEFQDWIFKDPERRETLVQTYNEMYNSIRPREYDGSHLNFVGMNTDITLKEHQKNAIARALYGGNTLLAHAVGAGKTFEMIAIAMEGKRLGLHTKSLFAVPNSLTEQMGNDFRRLYPNANILVATKKDFEKENRLKLFAKIAANDWDAVIVGHTQFDRMGLSPGREQQYITAELEKLREELEYAAEYGEKSFSVKKIEKAIASYQDRLNKLNDAQVKDDFIDFEKLGFDKLFIDECHLYKNLATATKMHNVSGLGSGGAARSFNLLMKSKYMDEITGGKGQTYASGTPIITRYQRSKKPILRCLVK